MGGARGAALTPADVAACLERAAVYEAAARAAGATPPPWVADVRALAAEVRRLWEDLAEERLVLARLAESEALRAEEQGRPAISLVHTRAALAKAPESHAEREPDRALDALLAEGSRLWREEQQAPEQRLVAERPCPDCLDQLGCERCGGTGWVAAGGGR